MTTPLKASLFCMRILQTTKKALPTAQSTYNRISHASHIALIRPTPLNTMPFHQTRVAPMS